MTVNATPDDRQLTLAPLDETTDHVRGAPAGRLIIEYGDYECPYSRQAFHAIEQVERQLGGNARFAFRHFPLTGIHPHALAAAAAAEAAALQGRFWDMHELLFRRQRALEDGDLRGYAAQLGLDLVAFDRDRVGSAVPERIRRDVDSGLASGRVLGTPTLFIDGVVHRGGYDPPALLAALRPAAGQTFAAVRHRTKVTKGPGSRAAGLAMAFKLIESAQDRWRCVNAPHLVALVRAGTSFTNGKLVERPGEEAQPEAA